MKTWIKAVREDLLDLKITRDLCEDRVAGRGKIHVANPTMLASSSHVYLYSQSCNWNVKIAFHLFGET